MSKINMNTNKMRIGAIVLILGMLFSMSAIVGSAHAATLYTLEWESSKLPTGTTWSVMIWNKTGLTSTTVSNTTYTLGSHVWGNITFSAESGVTYLYNYTGTPWFFNSTKNTISVSAAETYTVNFVANYTLNVTETGWLASLPSGYTLASGYTLVSAWNYSIGSTHYTPTATYSNNKMASSTYTLTIPIVSQNIKNSTSVVVASAFAFKPNISTDSVSLTANKSVSLTYAMLYPVYEKTQTNVGIIFQGLTLASNSVGSVLYVASGANFWENVTAMGGRYITTYYQANPVGYTGSMAHISSVTYGSGRKWGNFTIDSAPSNLIINTTTSVVTTPPSPVILASASGHTLNISVSNFGTPSSVKVAMGSTVFTATYSGYSNGIYYYTLLVPSSYSGAQKVTVTVTSNEGTTSAPFNVNLPYSAPTPYFSILVILYLVAAIGLWVYLTLYTKNIYVGTLILIIELIVYIYLFGFRL